MMPAHQLTHGPWRRWWRPWDRICRCGVGAWPCPVVVMLARQAAHRRPAANSRRRPSWDGPTPNLPSASLLTLGQQQRSNRRG